ncbi:hypothetical protein HK407_06g10940 [Ordospora pajunii]|uniref:uncharacterized protein n=1 Tax=Ordospora pajunii TaxID=3039483 RepID=UPI0029528F51|nr:uncharacterized protein HK407_06g10940 [Ordospora pajunii]KAH9411264.1 hypothetical protein HK407_06g10940 [Ordospora pajunii]
MSEKKVRRKRSIMVINGKGEAENLEKKSRDVEGVEDTNAVSGGESNAVGSVKNGMANDKENEIMSNAGSVVYDQKDVGVMSSGKDVGEKSTEASMPKNEDKQQENHDGNKGDSVGKKAVINEQHNKEYTVPKDGERSDHLGPEMPSDGKTKYVGKEAAEESTEARKGEEMFMPPVLLLNDINTNSEIFKQREDGNVVAEGWIWKKRRFFSCFWHQKYFVLTKDGILKYYKVNGMKYAKGNWDIKETKEIRHYDLASGDRHPYRLVVTVDTDSFILSFDEKDVKEYWVSRIAEVSEKSKNEVSRNGNIHSSRK